MEYVHHGIVRPCSSSATPPPPPLQSEVDDDLRRGPWTVEEDLILMNYIHAHGEGRWNSLARSAGLRRTGKSCRLRWLNYLRPDVRRGNITPEEQLLILELHSRWGNRWSKIAQHLPGRTDNEIKNYWRTRVQKHAKQLQCDVNSKQFKDIMRYLWMPRLAERIRAASGNTAAAAYNDVSAPLLMVPAQKPADRALDLSSQMKTSPENSYVGVGTSSESVEVVQQLSSPLISESFTGSYCGVQGSEDGVVVGDNCWFQEAQEQAQLGWPETLPSPCGAYGNLGLPDFDQSAWGESLWTVEDIWLQQQF